MTAIVSRKTPSGIAGFDEITRGGLPRGRTTVVEGGPGCGKTVFGLQALVHGARACGEPGIFVTFEESPARILENAERFGWDLPALQGDSLFLLDARPHVDMVQSGGFDLGGMLAALEAKVVAAGHGRIVFDALDIVLALLDDPMAARKEVYRLHEWLLERNVTALITCKTGGGSSEAQPYSLDFVQFMADCAVTLSHHMVKGVSQRSVRVVKYRGSDFEENEIPMIIADEGIDVAFTRRQDDATASVTSERLSSGTERLDTMLNGGYFRGASVLITGAPGTAKTTLAGAFVEAACQRGEQALFVSFDSHCDEIIRNLDSVDIHLDEHVREGRLLMESGRSLNGSAETHFLRIRRLAQAHGARCVVVDPLSSIAKHGNVNTAHSVVERLVDWAKLQGITLLCTSLLGSDTPLLETTPIQISTIADTWIHLSYVVHAGERNRGLTVVKSRGTAHSNQVRELILSHSGITLADAYMAGGEVLMGTLRFEKEARDRLAREAAATELRRREKRLETEAMELEAQINSLKRELLAKRDERAELIRAAEDAARTQAQSREDMEQLRGVDVPGGLEDS